jgi:hypothetical protein
VNIPVEVYAKRQSGSTLYHWAVAERVPLEDLDQFYMLSREVYQNPLVAVQDGVNWLKNNGFESVYKRDIA